jgi:hypothetical protein
MCQSKQRLCVICDKQLHGRSDKRFCNIKCKNKYHSELRASKKSYSQDVFKQILKNHRILGELIGENTEKFQIKKIVLQRLGFDTETTTSVKFQGKEIQFHVLDFYWKDISNNIIEVNYNPSDQTISPYVFKRFQRFGYSDTNSKDCSSRN